MYIIIVGAGMVGAEAARELVAAGHEVLVIEKSRAAVDAINEELGDIAMAGDGAEVRTQSEAGMARVDLVIATSGEDKVNLAVAQVAKQRFNAPRVIARINEPRNERIFKLLGVDVSVSATQAILAHIEAELPSHQLIHLMEFQSSDFELVEVVVPEGAPSVGQRVAALELPPRALVTLVLHADGRPEMPDAETVIDAGAVVVAVTLPEHENALRQALAGEE